MTFPSVVFLACFAPLFLICYFSLPWKNVIFFLFSLTFFYWGETKYIGVLFAYIFINYLFGRLVGANRLSSKGKGYLALGIVANCSLLFYYKYYYFLVTDVFPDLLGIVVTDIRHPHLPLGISYCTFHGISYLVDVYRGQVFYSRSVLDVGLYISMFPHLVAGPIVRYHTIAKALVRRCITSGRIGFGLRLFVIGLAQKVLIADKVGAVADTIFSLPTVSLDALLAWTGAISYTLQIYFDFCGYSFMAIGIGIVVGFRLPRNFRYPYASQSVTEFWRRWHISLSTWFRDYLYIPMGGNRLGTIRTLLNLLLVFFLCGLWHGAAYTFVFWGMFHGSLLIIERLGLRSLLLQLPCIVRHCYTMLGVSIGWVFFRSDTLEQAFSIIHAMFGFNRLAPPMNFVQVVNHEQILAFLLGFIFATPLVERSIKRVFWRTKSQWGATTMTFQRAFRLCFMLTLFMIALIHVLAGTYSPFLYFRF